MSTGGSYSASKAMSSVAVKKVQADWVGRVLSHVFLLAAIGCMLSVSLLTEDDDMKVYFQKTTSQVGADATTADQHWRPVSKEDYEKITDPTTKKEQNVYEDCSLSHFYSTKQIRGNLEISDKNSAKYIWRMKTRVKISAGIAIGVLSLQALIVLWLYWSGMRKDTVLTDNPLNEWVGDYSRKGIMWFGVIGALVSAVAVGLFFSTILLRGDCGLDGYQTHAGNPSPAYDLFQPSYSDERKIDSVDYKTTLKTQCDLYTKNIYKTLDAETPSTIGGITDVENINFGKHDDKPLTSVAWMYMVNCDAKNFAAQTDKTKIMPLHAEAANIRDTMQKIRSRTRAAVWLVAVSIIFLALHKAQVVINRRYSFPFEMISPALNHMTTFAWFSIGFGAFLVHLALTEASNTSPTTGENGHKLKKVPEGWQRCAISPAATFWWEDFGTMGDEHNKDAQDVEEHAEGMATAAFIMAFALMVISWVLQVVFAYSSSKRAAYEKKPGATLDQENVNKRLVTTGLGLVGYTLIVGALVTSTIVLLFGATSRQAVNHCSAVSVDEEARLISGYLMGIVGIAIFILVAQMYAHLPRMAGLAYSATTGAATAGNVKIEDPDTGYGGGRGIAKGGFGVQSRFTSGAGAARLLAPGNY